MGGPFFYKMVSKQTMPEGDKLTCASLEESVTRRPHS